MSVAIRVGQKFSLLPRSISLCRKATEHRAEYDDGMERIADIFQKQRNRMLSHSRDKLSYPSESRNQCVSTVADFVCIIRRHEATREISIAEG